MEPPRSNDDLAEQTERKLDNDEWHRQVNRPFDPLDKDDRKGALIGIGIAAVLLILCSVIASLSDTDTTPSKPPPQEPPCEDNATCMFDALASVKCSEAVEQLAKYDYEWTSGWKTFYSGRFSEIKWADKSSGIIAAGGNEIKFQNGFGVYQRYTYVCSFDLNTRSASAYAQPYN